MNAPRKRARWDSHSLLCKSRPKLLPRCGALAGIYTENMYKPMILNQFSVRSSDWLTNLNFREAEEVSPCKRANS